MVTNEIFDQSRFGILVCRGAVDFVSCGEVAPTEYPMPTMQDYELRVSGSNEQGLCTFTLHLRRTGLEVAHIDEPCLLEEALQSARIYVANMPPPIDVDEVKEVPTPPGWGDWVWLKR